MTASDSGETSTRPCPMDAAAVSVPPVVAGTLPSKVPSTPSVSAQPAPMPSAFAAVVRSSSASLRDSPTNAVLHETVKSWKKVGVPLIDSRRTSVRPLEQFEPVRTEVLGRDQPKAVPQRRPELRPDRRDTGLP